MGMEAGFRLEIRWLKMKVFLCKAVRAETILLGRARLRDGFLFMRLKNRENNGASVCGDPVYIGLVG